MYDDLLKCTECGYTCPEHEVRYIYGGEEDVYPCPECGNMQGYEGYELLDGERIEAKEVAA